MGEEDQASFTQLVLARAWFNAWRFFDSRLRDAVLFAVLFVAGGSVYYYLFGLPATKEQVAPVLIFTVGPMVALWVLLFVWHLWLAPAGLTYEAARAVHAPDTSENRNTTKIDPKINWAPWKQRSQYSLFEFAKILAKTDPAAQRLSLEGSSFLSLLVEEAKNGKMAVLPTYGADIWGERIVVDPNNETEIKKENAVRWAEEKQFPVDHIR